MPHPMERKMLTHTEYLALTKIGVPAEGRVAGALRGGWFIPSRGLFISNGPRGVYHQKPAADVADFRVLSAAE